MITKEYIVEEALSKRRIYSCLKERSDQTCLGFQHHTVHTKSTHRCRAVHVKVSIKKNPVVSRVTFTQGFYCKL